MERHVVIVGASLAGLMTALAAAAQGIRVTILERSADTGRTGAMLSPGHAMLGRLTGRENAPELTGSVQTWFAVHAHLRAGAEATPTITIEDGVSIREVAQNAYSAWAIAEDSRVFGGDLLVGADGHRSVVRRAVAPERPDARFAGYLIWHGIAREADLRARSRWPTGMLYEEAMNYILLGSTLPAEDGSEAPGERRLGWAMYDNGRNALLRDRGAVAGSIVRRSLFPHDIPADVFSGLSRDARLWPEPWRGAIIRCVEQQAIIGTPVAEYLPERLADDRICLVGDAAHVPTPMTGRGFAASLDDAIALGACLRSHASVTDASRAYEARRLASVRTLVESGQQFSRRYAA